MQYFDKTPYMKRILYVAIPVVILTIVLINAFFGHVILEYIYDRSINKYSVYIHLQPEWESYPNNILYDVTNVWSNHDINDDSSLMYADSYSSGNVDSPDIASLNLYNKNQLQYQNSKSYVELKHEFSDCAVDWRPIPYRYAADSIRNWIEIMQGVQITDSTDTNVKHEVAAQNDPYVWIFPNTPNDIYDASMQDTLVQKGYAQFIPICTSSVNSTSYDYSITINDSDIGFDVYFVKSKTDADAYTSGSKFDFYKQSGCHAQNYNSFAGTCHDVHPNSGLLIVIPDKLDLSLTKIRISLHEHF